MDNNEAKYGVHFFDAEGRSVEVAGDSLEQLASELERLNYDGANIRVYAEPGFCVGYVGGAGYWRAQ